MWNKYYRKLSFWTNTLKFSERNSFNMKGDKCDIKIIEEIDAIQEVQQRGKKRLQICHHFTTFLRAGPGVASAARISPPQLRHADRLSGASERLGRAGFDPKPSPLSPGHVRIMATANLTVLSVNSSHTGVTGGSLLNLQAVPSDVLLTRPLQLAVKYTGLHSRPQTPLH